MSWPLTSAVVAVAHVADAAPSCFDSVPTGHLGPGMPPFHDGGEPIANAAAQAPPASTPLLDRLPAALRTRLLARAETRAFGRRERVFEQDSAVEGLYIVRSGRLALLRSGAHERTMVLDQLGPGSHAGEMGLIDGQPHHASLVGEVRGRLLVVPRDDFLRCLAASPELAHALSFALSQRLRRANRRITLLALGSVRERVIDYLRHCTAAVDDAAPQRISRSEIARHIGASREMVSRILVDLERRGLVQVQPGGGPRCAVDAAQRRR